MDKETSNASARVRSNLEGGSPRWDISQERVLIETLVNQRFNYLTVFFGLVMAAGIQLRSWPVGQGTVFIAGALIAYFLVLTIRRANKKLTYIFEILKLDKAHPYTVINELAGPSGSVRRHIGSTVPLILLVVLIVSAVCSFLGLFAPPSPPAAGLTP